MAAGLHISISAEKVTSLGALNISNSILTSLIVSGLLIAFAVAVNSSLKKNGKPSGLQNLAEFIIESLSDLVMGVTNSKKKTQEFFPLVATFFLFILVNNWFGLLPGVGTIGFLEGAETTEHAYLQPSTVTVSQPVAYAATPTTPATAPSQEAHPETEKVLNPNQEQPHTETTVAGQEAVAGHAPVFVPYLRAGTADLNTTIALALMSVVMTQLYGFKYLGLSYLKKFFNFSNPIMFFVGILELISEFGKLLSFAFRLFGNVFAGEVLLVVMTALTYLVVPMPFYGLEIFVGFVQALVFSLLSVVFFNMASTGHNDH